MLLGTLADFAEFFLPSTCRTDLFSVAPSEGFVLSLCSSALSYLKGLRQRGVTSLSSPPSFLQGREAGQASLFPSGHAAALDALMESRARAAATASRAEGRGSSRSTASSSAPSLPPEQAGQGSLLWAGTQLS